MAGLLDVLTQPAGSFYNGLLNSSQVFPDVPADKDADAKKIWQKIQDETDKQNADADRRNAAGLAASSAPPPAAPVAGSDLPPVDPSLAVKMALGQGPTTPFGSLAPMAAQQPVVPPTAAPVAQAPVPMPQPRPAAAPPAVPAAQDQAAIPPNAQPTQGQDNPVAQPAPQPQEPSLLSKIGDKLSQNSNLLIGMGAGFAGAPSIGTGISRALTGASAGGQLDLKQAMQQGAIGPTYTALVKAGVPKEQALAAVYNPKILEAVTQGYIADRGKSVQIIKDAMGNEHPYEVNKFPKDGEPVLKPIDLGNGAAANNPSTAEPNYDPVTKRDEAFLSSLDPTTAAAVKDIADGNMSGTGRNLQKLMPYVARYEQGFSNGTYTARNKFNTELGSQSASTVGGQKVLMGTALGHLGEAAEAAAGLNNSDGMGSADAGHAYNAVTNRTTANAAKANALSDKVAKFSGEVGKLYSGSSGGGVHEREESRGRLGSNLTSAELAAGLESNRDLILSKQQALEQHAVDLFGPEGAKKFDFIGPEGRKSLEKIETAIAKLRGTAPTSSVAPAQAAPVTPTATGPNGHKIVVQNGRWVDAQTGQPVQ